MQIMVDSNLESIMLTYEFKRKGITVSLDGLLDIAVQGNFLKKEINRVHPELNVQSLI